MNEDLISVIDAAKTIELQKQTLFKVIKRLDVSTSKQKSERHKGQAISYTKKADFDLIIKS